MHRTFASARSSRNFRIYLSGHIVSAAGTWINFTAQSWLVLQLTGSGTALGLQAALMFGPVLVIGPWGGVIADKHDKRHILMVTQVAYAITALTLATVVALEVVQMWMVYGIGVASGIVTAFDNPARQTFTIEMVGADDLTNAVSLNSAAFMASRVVGPAIAGLLIASVGIAACFIIDGLSFFAVVAALSSMRTSELHPQTRTTRVSGHLVAGLRYVWQTLELRRPLLVMAVVFTLVFQWQVTVPLLAERVFGTGPREFGLLSAASGVGAFVGAIWMANRTLQPTMRDLARWVVVVGVTTTSVAFAPTLLLAGVALVPLGFAAMAFIITGNTMLQLVARPEARGRVMALYAVIFLGSTPFGAPAVGWIGEHLGPRISFLLGGGVAVALGLAMSWVRQRGRDRMADAVVEAG